MKKVFQIFAVVVGFILLVLLLTPVIFENQLKDLVQKTINENFNAEVAFADIDLSLFRNFPDATLGIEEMSVINKAPFKGDTLMYGKEVVLEMSVMELFRDRGEALQIDALTLDQVLLNIKVDSLGSTNYDIAIEDTTKNSSSSGDEFKFDLEQYEVKNSEVRYEDSGANIKMLVQELDHEGTGDLSAAETTLSTVSSALVSLAVDDIEYLNQNKVQLDADFRMDLENQKYSFLENKALINQLPLKFDGYVQVFEDRNEVDISFKTPTSSFKNFLAVIPEAYSKNIEEVQTSGDFVVDGFIRGVVDETYIPKMEINISSENASFQYPDLPKSVDNITIASQVLNTTGHLEDTYITIDTLQFQIDEDRFQAQGKIEDLTGNMIVDLVMNGTINLANLEKVYPIDLEQQLNGSVTADVSTRFDMNSIEQEQYQNIQSSGSAVIRDFSYSSPEIPNEIEIASAQMLFNSGNVTLENFVATTGQSDLTVNGSIENLLGYLLTDQRLKGNFKATSRMFAVNDFMVKEAAPEQQQEQEKAVSAETEAIKIPSILDVVLDFQAEQVIYDNLVLKDVNGQLAIANQTATLNRVTSKLFDGTITLSGNVSTANSTPEFGLKLNLKSIDIAQAFRDMELLRNLAPIARALQGTLSTDLELNGNLYDNLTPKLQSLAGTALAKIIGARVDPADTPLLSQLDQSLNFLDLDNLNLKDLETQLKFDNGKVAVAPFDFNIKGIEGTASGSHSFEREMDYTVALAIPAEYLGSTLGSAFSALSPAERDTLSVTMPIQITGSFNDPNINLNLEQAVNSLTQRIIASKKERLKEKGKDVLRDIITRKTGEDSTAAKEKQTRDSVQSKEEQVKEAAKDILGGIFGKNKKKKDTTDNGSH